MRWGNRFITPSEGAYLDLSKTDQTSGRGSCHSRVMAKKPETLARQEFASLLAVSNTSVNEPPAVIPAEHSARLIRLGYMADLSGRLRMTTPGRRRLAVGLEQTGAAQA